MTIKYTKRLAEAGIGLSVGNVGGGHDNVLAKTINGLCKPELFHSRGLSRSFEVVGYRRHRRALPTVDALWLKRRTR